MSESAGGRPTAYKPEYAQQAHTLALMGMSDNDIAWFFDASMEVLARWAWNSEEFFNAITPTDEQKEAHAARKRLRRTTINRTKRNRLQRDAGARLRNATSARMWSALKGKSDGALFGRLGYTLDDLKEHLERQFQPGMSWENYGAWHVDHVRPCCSFDQLDPKQFAECWSLGNLQPLWARENLVKGGSVDG